MDSPSPASTSVCASSARFIKLGAGGDWERLCIEEGTLRLGYNDVPHPVALASNREALQRHFLDRGFAQREASSHTRQVLDFYHAPADTLWVTFSDGFLWWCFAKPDVIMLDDAPQNPSRGSRFRPTVAGWSNRSIGGRVLRMSELNGRLTSVVGYRSTICNVEAFDYLLGRINDLEPSEVVIARAVREQALEAIAKLMQLLTWQDFELLVELVFGASGWRRIGQTGGTQKTIDLDLILPSTGERAFVQVKSQTNRAQLNDYVERLAGREESRMFFVYHSARGDIATADTRVTLVGPRRLSELVLEAGLFDWLITRAG